VPSILNALHASAQFRLSGQSLISFWSKANLIAIGRSSQLDTMMLILYAMSSANLVSYHLPTGLGYL
jgi:hypothetical protein